MSRGGKVFDKYLGRYAEPQASAVRSLKLDYERALVVPAYLEDPDFIQGFERAAGDAAGRTLCIVVVNQPTTTTRGAQQQNQACLARLLATGNTRVADEPPLYLVPKPALDLMVVDRLGQGFCLPPRQGTGLARKIGFDYAIAMYDSGQLRSPWIYSTDADATLPCDYFAFQPAKDAAAVSFPFIHTHGGDEQAHRATLIYEIQLRYRVLGLAWAGSRYAWHAVGSSLAAHASSYAAVRGFPKRAAGEDFHLLQKLSKVGAVEVPDKEPIALTSRASDRVPFGTGPSARQLLEGGPATLEAPSCFDALRRWLDWLEHATADDLRTPSLLSQVPGVEASTWEEHFAGCGFARFAETALAGPRTPERLHRRKRDWFDGLRQQQLLHLFRRAHYAKLPMHRALETARFVPRERVAPMSAANLEAIRQELVDAERSLPRLRGPHL